MSSLTAVNERSSVGPWVQDRITNHEIKKKLDEAGNFTIGEPGGVAIEAYRNLLEKAYALAIGNVLDPVLPEDRFIHELLVADIMHRVARTYYNADYDRCRRLLQKSLLTQIYAVDKVMTYVPNWRNSHTLERLGEARPRTDRLWLLVIDDEVLKKWEPSTFVEAMQKLPEEYQVMLASTLRLLAHCFMNLDEFNSHEPTNNWRLLKIYQFAEALLQPLAEKGDADAVNELGELIYNVAPGLHLRAHPDDVEGAAAVLDEVFKYDNSAKMQARIANKKACMLPVEKAVVFGEKALHLWTEVVDPQDVDPFLLANCQNTVARLWMLCGRGDKLPRIEKLLKEAVAHAEESQAQGKNHYYFATYFINFARLEILRKDSAAAKQWIDKAEVNINAFPDSSAELRKTLEEVKKAWEGL